MTRRTRDVTAQRLCDGHHSVPGPPRASLGRLKLRRAEGKENAMKTTRSPVNGGRLLLRGLDRREGRRMRQIRRALAAAGGQPVTTRDLMAAVYYRGEPWIWWRWRRVRESAERYAERMTPKTRPL